MIRKSLAVILTCSILVTNSSFVFASEPDVNTDVVDSMTETDYDVVGDDSKSDGDSDSFDIMDDFMADDSSDYSGIDVDTYDNSDSYYDSFAFTDDTTNDTTEDIDDVEFEEALDSDFVEEVSGVEDTVSSDDVVDSEPFEEEPEVLGSGDGMRGPATLSSNQVDFDDYWLDQDYCIIADSDYECNVSSLSIEDEGVMGCGSSWILYSDGTMVIDITQDSDSPYINMCFVDSYGDTIDEDWWEYCCNGDVKSLWFKSSDDTDINLGDTPDESRLTFERAKVERVHFDKNIKKVYTAMFNGCSTLRFVQFPDDVTFGSSLFAGCSSLAGIVSFPLHCGAPYSFITGNNNITAVRFDLSSFSNLNIPVMSAYISGCNNVSDFYVTDKEGVSNVGSLLMGFASYYSGPQDMHVYVDSEVSTVDIYSPYYSGGSHVVYFEYLHPESITYIKRFQVADAYGLNLADMVNLEHIGREAFANSTRIVDWGFSDDRCIDFTKFSKLKKIDKAAFGVMISQAGFDNLVYEYNHLSNPSNTGITPTWGGDDEESDYIGYSSTNDIYYSDGSTYAGDTFHNRYYRPISPNCRNYCPQIDTVILPDFDEITSTDELDVYYNTTRTSRCKFVIDTCAFAGCNIKNLDVSRMHGYYIGEYAFAFCPIENDLIFPDDFVGFESYDSSYDFVFNQFKGKKISLPVTALPNSYYGGFGGLFYIFNSFDSYNNCNDLTYTKGSLVGMSPSKYGKVDFCDNGLFGSSSTSAFKRGDGSGNGDGYGRIHFGDGITSIKYGCYGGYYSSNVIGITFPDDGNLKSIDSYGSGSLYGVGYDLPSFLQTKNLRYDDIYFPDSVEYLGENLFGGKSVTSQLLYNGGSLNNGSYDAKHIHIPRNLKAMGPYCFSACFASDFDFSQCYDLTEFSDYAFYGSHIKNLKYPANLNKVGDSCFSDCVKFVNKFYLPDSVTWVGNSAFNRCTSMTGDVVFSDNVTVLGTGIFDGCTSLSGTVKFPNRDLYKTDGKKIQKLSDFPSVKDCMFSIVYMPVSVMSKNDDFYNTLPVNVRNLILEPGDSGEMMNSTNDANDEFSHLFWNIPRGGTVKICDGVKNIGDYLFKNSNVSSLDFSENTTLEKIGIGAFENCSLLTGEFVVPDNVEYIGTDAFSKTNFESVSIPVTCLPSDSGVRSIFRQCNRIKVFKFTKGSDNEYYGRLEGTWPDLDYEDYWEYAPYFADSDNHVIIEKGVKNIGKYAFSNAIGLANLSMPVDIDIDATSFDDDNVIANVILTEGSETNDILDSTLDGEHDCYLRYPWNKSSLNTVNVDLSGLDGINKIGDYAFYTSSNAYVVLPDSVTEIGDYAFYKNLSPGLSLFDMSSFKVVGDSAFYECKTLPAIVDLSAAESLGDESYYNCDNIDGIYVSTELVHDDFGEASTDEIDYIVNNGYAYYTGEPTDGGACVIINNDEFAKVYYGTTKDDVTSLDVPQFTDIGSHTVRFKIVKDGSVLVTGSLIVNITEYKEYKSKINYTVVNGVSDYVTEPTNGGAEVIIDDADSYTNLVIKYAETEGEYVLDEIPKYATVGNHCIYFKITADGYEDTYGTLLVLIGKMSGSLSCSDDEIYLYNRKDASSYDISLWSPDGNVRILDYDDSYVSVSLNKIHGAIETDPATLTISAKGYVNGKESYARKFGTTEVTLVKDASDEYAGNILHIIVHVVDSSGEMVSGRTFNDIVNRYYNPADNSLSGLYEYNDKFNVVFAVEDMRRGNGYIDYNGNHVKVPSDAEVMNLSTSDDIDYYAFVNDDILYVVGRDKPVTLNEDSSFMFYNFNLGYVDFNDSVDFSKVKKADYWFARCSIDDLHCLDDFDTSGFESMSAMFSGLKTSDYYFDFLKLDSCVDMSGMFSCIDTDVLDLSALNTSGVENMSRLFTMSSIDRLDISSFDTSSVKDMSEMFTYLALSGPLDISGFDTSSVESMAYMFAATNLDVLYPDGGFDISNVENMKAMYAMSDIEEFDVNALFGDSVGAESLIDCSYMLTGCENLKSVNLVNFKAPKLDTIEGMFSYCLNLDTLVFDFYGYDVNVDYVCSNCPKLKYLDMSCIHNGDIKFDGSNIFGVATSSGKFIRSYRSYGDSVMNDRGKNKPCHSDWYDENVTMDISTESSVQHEPCRNFKDRQYSYSDSYARIWDYMSSPDYVSDFNVYINGLYTLRGYSCSVDGTVADRRYLRRTGYCIGNTYSSSSYIDSSNRMELRLPYDGLVSLSEYAPLSLEVFKTPKYSEVYDSLRGSERYKIDCLPYTMRDGDGNEYREIPHDNKSITLYKLDDYLDVDTDESKGFYDQDNNFVALSDINYFDRDFKSELIYYVYNDFNDIYIKGIADDNISDVTGAQNVYTDFSNHIMDDNMITRSYTLTVTLNSRTYFYVDGELVNIEDGESHEYKDMGYRIDLSKYHTWYGYDKESMPDWAYYAFGWKLKNLQFNADMKSHKMQDYFTGMNSLESVVFGSESDVRGVDNFVGCFAGCSSLNTVDMSNLDMSAVKDNTHFDYMFAGCKNLNDIYIDASYPDIFMKACKTPYEFVTNYMVIDTYASWYPNNYPDSYSGLFAYTEGKYGLTDSNLYRSGYFNWYPDDGKWHVKAASYEYTNVDGKTHKPSTNVFIGAGISLADREATHYTENGSDWYPNDLLGFSRYAIKDGIFKGKAHYNDHDDVHTYFYNRSNLFIFKKQLYLHHYMIYNDDESYLKPESKGGFLKIKP